VDGLYACTLAQFLASALKEPLLLLGTTAVCFPTFFVMQYVLAPRALSLYHQGPTQDGHERDGKERQHQAAADGAAPHVLLAL
jgi:hypothetical protein